MTFNISKKELFINDYLLSTANILDKIRNSEKYINSVIDVSRVIIKALNSESRVYIAGNGGSAADAQHFAAELVSRFMFDRNPLPAIALTTDSSCLTSIGNDYGFEQIFSRQLKALGQKGDVFIGISTSGNSENILRAFNLCKEKGVISIALSGVNGMKSFNPDFLIDIPSDVTPVIQEMHLITYHMLCSMIEIDIFKEGLIP